ncbi:hypothetical protein K437DRAFT_228310 [Tilletiaria anomala UBC 951]|uniref:MI domain-containing protein n=1 Tax=Tilletiaria anomala (strain ATCC 24038 / CBS 436.72 / UBC 951) TaxID=1037660 RepID=A0A066VJM2_TILAU|nr:uncharacterized protein K437DRAFT_228310 [Tilletiaria anomala UBC 951]KDN38929.1 hypothetical protein K437DRAFT_228310 [Tilletiaria anomala UBC 951]
MFSDAEDEASDEEEDGADESDSSEEEDGDAVDDLDGLDDDDGSDEGAGFDLDEEEGGDEDENGIDTVYLQHFQLDSNVSASEVASSRVADGDEEEAPAIDDGGSSAVAGNQAAPQGRYIPPALRKAMEASAAQANAGADSLDDPATAGLRRQLKGLLNRMGEGNLETILTQLEGIYRFNSRAIVSETLTRLILDTITASTNLADTFVVLYAALIASLHKVIGVEFAAGFVQTLVDELLLNYDAAGRALDPYDDPQSKKALNLTSLLCELYNLQVVACPLVYDLIRHFAGAHTNSNKRAAGGITELSVELLLKIVKICGAQLRHDDPTSLRDIVDLIQQSATGTANKLSAPSTAEQSMSSRSRFMLERLADLKNAKGSASKSAAANNSAATESLNRMKKFLAGLGKKRTLRAHDLLRVTLRDLLDAERKGKWWLVGAAWTGHGDQEKDQATGVTAARPLSGSSVTAVVKERGDSEATETERTRQKLLGYARTHGMSTETRRSIFLVIMTSEDFVDAAQKLLELRLNEVQRRDIIRVLLQCLDMDEVYNPYYALIGWRLATDSHSTRFTMQYALWDFLRSIGESGVAGRSRAEAAAEHGADEDGEDVSERKLAHVARAYAWWIAKEALSLNILKTVDFTSLKPKGTLFLQLLLVNVFLSTQSAAPSLVTFVKSKDANSQPGAGDRKSLETCLLKGTAGNPDLARGLLYFLRKDLGKRDVKRILGKSAAKAASLRLTWALEVAEEILEVGASIDLAM